jgi:gluconate 2-dehydrogenase gamma chain
VPASLHTFSKGQAETVEAILERMIPSGGSGDGAREAGVLRYIDRALAGDYRDLAGDYRANLNAVDAYSHERFARNFTELGGADADAVITAIEKGAADGFTPDAGTFFLMLRAHALEGMFGDPYYGGNQRFVGWKLVQYPGPALVVPAAHQRLDVKVPAKFTSMGSSRFEMLPNVGPVGPPDW